MVWILGDVVSLEVGLGVGLGLEYGGGGGWSFMEGVWMDVAV